MFADENSQQTIHAYDVA